MEDGKLHVLLLGFGAVGVVYSYLLEKVRILHLPLPLRPLRLTIFCFSAERQGQSDGGSSKQFRSSPAERYPARLARQVRCCGGLPSSPSFVPPPSALTNACLTSRRCLPLVVHSVEEAADFSYAFVVVTTKSLPDVLPTEVLLKPIIDAGKASTFLLIQASLPSHSGPLQASL
jgi:hypothetical protein